MSSAQCQHCAEKYGLYMVSIVVDAVLIVAHFCRYPNGGGRQNFINVNGWSHGVQPNQMVRTVQPYCRSCSDCASICAGEVAVCSAGRVRMGDTKYAPNLGSS